MRPAKAFVADQRGHRSALRSPGRIGRGALETLHAGRRAGERVGGDQHQPARLGQRLRTALRQRRLRHGGDAVLNWCASNVTPRRDENLNMAPDRKRSADKIDDACALFMGVGVMGVAPQPVKKFQLLFV